MTTPTAPHAPTPATPHAPTPATAQAADTVSVFVLITVQNHGQIATTTGHTLTIASGTTHADLAAHVTATCIAEDMRGGVVLHYSVHPAVIT
ncbi:hypothetical protein ACIBKY_39130 [Nonomuraea sp. NPDC050394]|uniref:hypothetical protein n=1 Tax=Nonomuraea sp. NPDC050394 TaxID=3364363 RepID=UPI0037A19411